MAVPSRAEAASLLLEIDPPPWLVAHSTVVAEVAAFLATRIAERGHELDRAVVEAAALLHDVDKSLDEAHPLRRLGHGPAGAAWLAERGYSELAPAVEHHPVTLLGDDARYAAWIADASLEQRLVAYADKRATRTIVSLDERFGEWLAKHPEHAAELRVARERADALEQELCAAAGIDPEQVERRPWVAEAMRAPTSSAR